MPNIAAVLKGEISRVARKEVRGELATLKKAVLTYRGEIAALKRRAQALDQQVRRLGRSGGRAASAAAEEAPAASRRFSAKGLASYRRRMKLSVHDCGLLVGASAQSIYNWEEGKTHPRESHLQTIAALKGLGKREIVARLTALKSSA